MFCVVSSPLLSLSCTSCPLFVIISCCPAHPLSLALPCTTSCCPLHCCSTSHLSGRPPVPGTPPRTPLPQAWPRPPLTPTPAAWPRALSCCRGWRDCPPRSGWGTCSVWMPGARAWTSTSPLWWSWMSWRWQVRGQVPIFFLVRCPFSFCCACLWRALQLVRGTPLEACCCCCWLLCFFAVASCVCRYGQCGCMPQLHRDALGLCARSQLSPAYRCVCISSVTLTHSLCL